MALNCHVRANATTMVRGLSITINLEMINRVKTLPLGVQWRKEGKSSNDLAKNNLFIDDEKLIEDKNGVRRESLLYPWDEVAYHILKFIPCDGRRV